MRNLRKSVGVVLAAGSLLTASAAAAGPAPAVGGSGVDCTAEGIIRTSETLGILAPFGAQCDHHLDVNTRGQLYRNGVLVKSLQKNCRNMKQGAYCESYVSYGNSAGAQTWKLVTTVDYRPTGTNSTWTRVTSATSRVL